MIQCFLEFLGSKIVCGKTKMNVCQACIAIKLFRVTRNDDFLSAAIHMLNKFPVGNTDDGVYFDRHAIQTISGAKMQAFIRDLFPYLRPGFDRVFIMTSSQAPSQLFFLSMFFSSSKTREKSLNDIAVIGQSTHTFQSIFFRKFVDLLWHETERNSQ